MRQNLTIFNFEFLILNSKTAGLRKAFSLVEILIVVGILGILAAIVMPEYQNHSIQAKEAAAKDNLRILRNAIEIYAAEHNDCPPGYPGGDRTQTPNSVTVLAQLTKYTDRYGNTSDTKTDTYRFGPYINKTPENPDTNDDRILLLATKPETATGLFGWIYVVDKKQVFLDSNSTDSQGVSYYDY